MKSSESAVAETLRMPGVGRMDDGAGIFAVISVVGGGASFGIAGAGVETGGAGFAVIAGGCALVLALAFALAPTARLDAGYTGFGFTTGAAGTVTAATLAAATIVLGVAEATAAVLGGAGSVEIEVAACTAGETDELGVDATTAGLVAAGA